MSDPALEIRMQRRGVDCSVCGSLTELRYGIPTYNGDIVSVDFPNWLWQYGGSVPVCQDCFDKHAKGEMYTYDRFYIPDTVMGVHLVNGGGI